MKVIHYLLPDGRIIGSLTDYSDMSAVTANLPAGWGGIEAPDQTAQYDAETWYVTGSPAMVTLRPACPVTLDVASMAANGIATATLSGIPTGAAIIITDANGDTKLTADGTALEITADAADVITVVVTLFPYRDGRYQVIAA